VRRSLCALAVAFILAGCGRGRSTLPESRQLPGAVLPPPAQGLSEEFKQMKVPPGQLVRILPVGEAWTAGDAPVYRSLCLRCHSVSQTSFSAKDWRESLHARAGVLCGNCHGSHEVNFVPQPGPDRCLMCHPQEVEEYLVSKHGPEKSPGMRCVSCHEAHATDRGLAKSVKVCTGCHLGSEHVQGFAESRMGEVLATHLPGPSGEIRAPDCAYCHQPDSPIMRKTGDFRNDRVTIHDPAVTVAKNPKDSRRLAEGTIEFLLPLCVSCHSERNARYRLENSDPLIRRWTPVGMTGEVRRRPVPDAAGSGTTGSRGRLP
jgi:hypothetical protein